MNIVFVILAGIAIVIGVLIEALDWAARLDYIEAKFPNAIKWGERRHWRFVLLIVCLILLSRVLYDLEREQPLTLRFPSPDAGAKDAEIAHLKEKIQDYEKRLSEAHPQEHLPCLQPVGFTTQRTQVSNMTGGYYAIRISIPNSTGIAPGSSFQFFFARRTQLYGVTDSDGNKLPDASWSIGTDISNISLRSGLPKGKGLLVTALSGEMPVRLRCIDRMPPAKFEKN